MVFGETTARQVLVETAVSPACCGPLGQRALRWWRIPTRRTDLMLRLQGFCRLAAVERRATAHGGVLRPGCWVCVCFWCGSRSSPSDDAVFTFLAQSRRGDREFTSVRQHARFKNSAHSPTSKVLKESGTWISTGELLATHSIAQLVNALFE